MEQEVASGGMGTVFRALDETTGAHVALKVVADRSASTIGRFMREVDLLRALVHPGIVSYVAHGTLDDGKPWLAMEWLEGVDLATKLRDGRLGVAGAIALGLRLADALAFAHEREIVHRDLKPQNVFLPDGDVMRAKLLDFGVARLVQADSMTQTGTAIGTPGYMAPEQARGDHVDARADLFALGAVLFEAASGRVAFEGQHVMAVLARILLEEAPRLRKHVPDAPDWLDGLVAKLLEKDPARRPESALAVARKLNEGAIGQFTPRTPTGPPRRATLGRSEQRVVTVVLAPIAVAGGPILVDAPTLVSGESVMALAALRALIGSEGARIERLVDGSIVVLVSGDESARDQVVRAARAARELLAAIDAPRVAIATGLLVVDETVPVGDVIDRAVRMLMSGDWTGARLDETSRELVDERFETHTDGEVTLLGAEREEGGVRAPAGGPLVGREPEIALLEAAYEAAACGDGARAVVVTGAPGSGKSRLRRELVRRISGRGRAPLVLIGRGDQVGGAAAYAAMAIAIRRAAGIHDGEPLEVQRAKLTSLVGRRVEQDLDEVVMFIGEMVGVPFPADEHVGLGAARASPVLMADRIRDAWRVWIAAETAVAPVAIVLDDFHWGDPPSALLVDHLLRTFDEAPVFVLALARPEPAARAKLASERHVTEIRLSPLSRSAASSLARHWLGANAPEGSVARVVALADGNPLFLEELARAELAGESTLPTTILASVQRRLDAIAPEVRHVLRAASIVGTSFWDGAVRALVVSTDVDVDAALARLSTERLVTLRATSTIAGEVERTFASELVREAAYETLTPEDRALGHALAAQWLTDRSPRRALSIAEHLWRGGERILAARHLLVAARDSLDAGDFAAAVAHASRGIEGVTGMSSGALGAELHLVVATAERWAGHPAEALVAAEVAGRLCERGFPLWFRAMAEGILVAHRAGRIEVFDAWVDGVMRTRGETEEARLAESEALGVVAGLEALRNNHARARDAMARADALLVGMEAPNPHVISRLDIARAVIALFDGDLELGLALNRKASAHARRIRDVRGEISCAINEGFTLDLLGRADEAVALFDSVLGDCDRLGISYTGAFVRSNRGAALTSLGRYDEAIAVLREVMSSDDARSHPRIEGNARFYLALALVEKGDYTAALAEALAAAEILRPYRTQHGTCLAIAADALRALGDLAAAEPRARFAIEDLRAAGGSDYGESLIHVVHAEIQFALGNTHSALAALRDGLARLEHRARLLSSDDARRKLYAVGEHARLLARLSEWDVPE